MIIMKFITLIVVLIGLSSFGFAKSDNPCQSLEVVSRNETLVNPVVCSLCKTAVKIVDYEIQKFNTSIVVVEKIVADLCCLIGGEPVYKECLPLLEKIQDIINWILKGLTPGQICQKLGMC